MGAFNGSGTFVRTYSWADDRDAGIKIRADRSDTEDSGFAAGLSNCLTKDGQNTATANQPMGGFRHTNVGNATARNQYAAAGQIQDESFIWCGVAGGTADAVTLTPTPAIAAYAAGQRFVWLASAAPNTTAMTIAVSGLATKAAQNDGAALVAGDHAADKMFMGLYDGTAFQIMRVRLSLPRRFPDAFALVDDSDNELIVFQKATTAVNQFDVGNAATGTSPFIEATGDDTDIDIALVPKGTGVVKQGTTPVMLAGKHTIGVGSGGVFPAITSGCTALQQFETSSNKVNYKYLAFDAAAVKYGHFDFPSPKSYNASTMTFIVHWAHPATTTNFGVSWALELLSLANDDAGDTAYGTAVQVNDTGGTTGDIYFTAESSAVTPSNTAAKQDRIFARISRVATDAVNDTLAVDAYLIGITVLYTLDAGNDV